MNKLKIGILILGVGASAGVSLAIRHRANVRLSERVESVRQQADKLAALSAENGRLAALTEKLKSTQPLSRDELLELLRLRGQAALLREAVVEKPRLEAVNAGLRAKAAVRNEALAQAQAAPNYWPKDQLAYAGFADPASALKSVLWSMSSADASNWRSYWTPEAVAQAEKECAQEGIAATNMVQQIKEMGSALTSASEGFHIVKQQMTSRDETVISLSFDGEGATRKFVLRRIGGEWKFHKLIFAGGSIPRL